VTLLESAERVVDDDPVALAQLALAEGWGDGLPFVAPTPELVLGHVAASGLDAATSLGPIPPLRTQCTVERVAINAVMAGAPPEAMPLLCAAIGAMVDPAFDLAGVNTTTASVVPALIVNGPQRHALGIPFGASAFGGVASVAPAIGRALRLVMRNVGGQVAGETSESVFGQPARVVGIVVGEWEERSPWPALAARRGVGGDAVTVYGALGTCNILDTLAESGREILEVIGRSLGFMGNNNFMPASRYADQLVAINPTWANEVIARDVPSFDDVREIIWSAACLPIDAFPAELRPGVERARRIERGGRVMLMDSPEELHIMVCGGLGGLHATMLPGFSHSVAVTRPVP
jgi:hypothetical protein